MKGCCTTRASSVPCCAAQRPSWQEASMRVLSGGLLQARQSCRSFAIGLIAALAVLMHARSAWAQAGDSCPLNPRQQGAAVKAFKGLAPIFQEERCLNCHGAVNPFSRDGGHVGGFIDIRQETKEFLKRPDFRASLPVGTDPGGSFLAKAVSQLQEIADSPSEVTSIDLIRAKALIPMLRACEGCHIAGWLIPISENHFVKKNAKAMCVHMKTSKSTNSPTSFLRHMQDDALVLVGFKGTRGLLEAVTPEPPKIPFATVEKFANDWVEAMGRQFHPPPDCGCKAGLVLSFQHRVEDSLTTMNAKVGNALFDGEVSFDVSLAPVSNRTAENRFAADLSVVRPLRVRHTTPRCLGSGSQTEDWQIRALVDRRAGTVKLDFGFATLDPRAHWVCDGKTIAVDPSVFTEVKQVEIPLRDGANKSLQLLQRSGHALEWLTITVVDAADLQ
jgi:hypothetical protein